MKVLIDRFENGQAIVELPDGQFSAISSLLIPSAKEGDFIRIDIDHESRTEREEHIKTLMDQLFCD